MLAVIFAIAGAGCVNRNRRRAACGRVDGAAGNQTMARPAVLLGGTLKAYESGRRLLPLGRKRSSRSAACRRRGGVYIVPE